MMTEARRSRVRVLLIFLLFMLSAVAFLDRTNISVAGVQMRQEYGLDQIHLGWVFSAFLIGYAAFQVPAGWLAVRIGPRKVLTYGVIWWGMLSAATALVSPSFGSTVLQLIIVRFLLGAGEAVIYPGRQPVPVALDPGPGARQGEWLDLRRRRCRCWPDPAADHRDHRRSADGACPSTPAR